MTIKELVALIKKDSKRTRHGYWKKLLYPNPVKLVFLFRINSYLSSKTNIFVKLLSIPLKMQYRFNCMFLGIQLPLKAQLGGGISFKHYSCIVIVEDAKIGENCSIHQGVTIGRSFGGSKKREPDNR